MTTGAGYAENPETKRRLKNLVEVSSLGDHLAWRRVAPLSRPRCRGRRWGRCGWRIGMSTMATAPRCFFMAAQFTALAADLCSGRLVAAHEGG